MDGRIWKSSLLLGTWVLEADGSAVFADIENENSLDCPLLPPEAAPFMGLTTPFPQAEERNWPLADPLNELLLLWLLPFPLPESN